MGGGVGVQEDQIEVENLATGCFLSPGNQSQSSSLFPISATE